jgi:hypothetical protein
MSVLSLTEKQRKPTIKHNSQTQCEYQLADFHAIDKQASAY